MSKHPRTLSEALARAEQERTRTEQSIRAYVVAFSRTYGPEQVSK